MPTSVPNFNFLARLVSEMWGGPKIKSGSSWFRQRPLADKFLYRELVRVDAYKWPKFQLPGSIFFFFFYFFYHSWWIKMFISFRDKEVVLKLNVGATSPLPYPVRWKFYVFSKYLARSNGAPNFNIVSLCIMQLCEYVFCIGFPLYVPKNGFFGGFEGEDVKILSSDPKRHYPVRIRVCWFIACQNRFNGLSSRSVERFLRTKKEIKKIVW